MIVCNEPATIILLSESDLTLEIVSVFQAFPQLLISFLLKLFLIKKSKAVFPEESMRNINLS